MRTLILWLVLAACSESHAGEACKTSNLLLPDSFALLARGDAGPDATGVEVIAMPNGELIVDGQTTGTGLDGFGERLAASHRAAERGVLLVVAPTTTWARIVGVVRAIEAAGAHRIGFVYAAQPSCPGVVWLKLDDRARAVHYKATATWADLGKKLPAGSAHFTLD